MNNSPVKGENRERVQNSGGQIQAQRQEDQSLPLMRGFGLLRGKSGPFPGVDNLMPMVGVIWDNLSGGRNGGVVGGGQRSREQATF